MNSKWNRFVRKMKKKLSYREIKKKEGVLRLQDNKKKLKKRKDKMRRRRERKWNKMRLSKKEEQKKCSKKIWKRLKIKDLQNFKRKEKLY